MRQPRASRGRAAAVALAVVLAGGGSALSLGLAQARAADDRQAVEQGLDRQAAVTQQAVDAEIDRYVDALRLVAASASSYDRLTAEKFATATEPMASMRLAGATSVTFLPPPVADRDVASVQADWRSRGAAGLVLHPVGTRDHVFSVLTRTLDGSAARRTGVDVSQAAAPSAALQEARRSDRVAVSDSYQLIIDAGLPAAQRQMSFVLAAPVWTRAADRTDIRGWILLGVRGQDFMGQVLRRTSQQLVDVELRAPGQDGTMKPVAGVRAPGDGERELQRTTPVPVAQRTWELRTSAVAADQPGGDRGVAVLALGGCAISGLLAALVLLLATGRARAQARVREATAELRAAEAEARRQAGLLTAVLDSITDGVGVVDERGAFLVHNRAARALLGVGGPGELGDLDDPAGWQTHYGLHTPDGSRPFPTRDLPLVRALAGESSDGVEMLVRNPGVPRGTLLSVTGRPLHVSAGQPGAVAVFRDITVERARQADLAAFAGVVAHDLKTPLTVVSGYSELLQELLEELLADPARARQALDAEAVADCLRRVRGAAGRMHGLIDDLLAYTAARDAQLQVEPVDLRELAVDVAAGAGGVYVGDLPVVLADRGGLRQVLENLVGNALKYTAPGRAPRVEVTAHELSDGACVVEVADRGIGIPAGQHTAVFSRFHRAHADAYPGTGLGLAICERIVERHGGSIAASDNPGGGTRVSFVLPGALRASGAHVPAGALSGV